MTFKQLEYFLAFAACKNYTTAAKMCFTTQPNLSRQIENLEKELELKLTMRIDGKNILTDAGQLLEERGSQLMVAYNEMLAELSSGTKPDLVFGYTTRHELMDQLRKYVGQEFCGYRIQWVHGTGDILLNAGLLDMCFTFAPGAEYYVKLTDANIYAIVPRMLMSARKQLELSDLETNPVMLPTGSLREVCLKFFRENDLHPEIQDFPAVIFDKSIYMEQLQATRSIGFVPIDDYRIYESNFFLAKVNGLETTIPVGIQWAAKKDRDCRPIAEKILAKGKKSYRRYLRNLRKTNVKCQVALLTGYHGTESYAKYLKVRRACLRSMAI